MKSGGKISIYLLWDASFILWMTTHFIFDHSIIGMIALFSFVLLSIMMIYRQGFNLQRKGLWLPYILFIGYSYLSILTGHSIDAASSMALMRTLLINLVFFLCVIYYTSYMDMNRFKKIYILSSIISSAVVLLLNYRLVHSFIIRESEEINGNVLAVSNAIVVCWMICTHNTRDNRIREICTIIFLLLFCVLAGTRKAVFALVIGLTIFFLFNEPKKIIRNILVVIIILSLLYFAMTEIPFIYNVIGYRMETLFSFLQGGEGAASEETRMRFIERGLEYYHRSPVWGNGINCFKLTSNSSYKTYSHNNYVELLFSTGFVGTIFYYLMYASLLLKNAYGIRRRERNSVISFSIIIVILFCDFAMVSYYSRSTFMLIAMCYFLGEQKIGNDDN